MTLRYVSVCSGIESATVAWHPLGWQPVCFAEIAPFPSRVLAHRYPGVPNVGDFTKIETEGGFRVPAPGCDLLVGGTPCQAFSVAGLRGGLSDARGNLALEFMRLADRLRPRWVVWENVPGVLSSSGGRDFGSILGALGELGYGFAYRVLDARFFGVAQQRKRVFVVGRLGNWRGAAAVLFERESMRRDTPPRFTPGSVAPRNLERRAQSRALAAFSIVPHSGQGADLRASEIETSPAVTAEEARMYERGARVVMLDGVRRLTPREDERLQGFPDDYTAIPGAADADRYFALGNSMAVPVMRWIGERIATVHGVR